MFVILGGIIQNFTLPGGWGPVLHFIHENRLALQGALTAFFIALLFSLWDGVDLAALNHC